MINHFNKYIILYKEGSQLKLNQHYRHIVIMDDSNPILELLDDNVESFSSIYHHSHGLTTRAQHIPVMTL